MKKALMVLVLLFQAVCGIASEPLVIKNNPAFDPDTFTVISATDRETLIEYIKSYPQREGDVLSLTLGNGLDAKTLVIPRIQDVPLKSVKTECPKSIKANNCWFIKYEKETP
mgnify:CR=1 FL=1